MKRYLKNSGFGILQIAISIGLVFFSIPVFIQTNGLKIYGLFSIVSIFGNLTLLFNLGLNTTLLKFITSNHSTDQQNKHVSVSLFIIASITIFFTIILLLAQNLIIGDFLQIDENLRSDVVIAFRLFLLANLFIMLGQPFAALCQANNDFYITNLLQLLYNIINWGLIILFCKLHYSFKILSLPAVISAIVWFTILVFVGLFKYKFRLIFFYNKKIELVQILKQQLAYSMQVYVNSLISFANEPLLKLLVAKYLGPQAVGSLDIIIRIKTQLIALLQKAFEPMSAIVAAEHNLKKLRNIIHYTEQLAVYIIVPFSFCIFLFSGFFLKIWLHEISYNMILSIKIAIVIFTTTIIVVPNYFFLTFHGKIKDCMKIQGLAVIVSLAIFFSCKNIFKENTPVISLCSGIISAFLLNLHYQWKYLKSLIFEKKDLFYLFTLIIIIILFYYISLYNYYTISYILVIIISIYSILNMKKIYTTGLISF